MNKRHKIRPTIFWQENNPYIKVGDPTGETVEMHIDTWCATLEELASDPDCILPSSWIKKAVDDSNQLRLKILPNQTH